MRRVALTLMCAGLLAGCGGDEGGSTERLSKSEYERDYRAAAERVASPRIDSGTETPEQVVATFTEARKRILRFASEVEKLRPPAEVEQAHRDLIAGLRSIAADLDPVLASVREDGEKALERLYAERDTFASPRTVELARRARAGFAAKGYDIQLEGTPGATP